MTIRSPWRIAAVLAVLTLAAAARAEVKDAAELLPAQTLACVEVRQPERLAREISALVKGSELDDMPAVMAKFREKLGDNMPFYFFNEAAMMSLLFSPEMINECGRVQGGVVAVTGINKDGPELVGVVLAGDSNLPDVLPARHAHGRLQRPRRGRGRGRAHLPRTPADLPSRRCRDSRRPCRPGKIPDRSWPCCRPRSSSAPRPRASRT